MERKDRLFNYPSECSSWSTSLPRFWLQGFAQLKDARMGCAKRHTLLDILNLSSQAMFCGADTFVAIEDFGESIKE